MDEEDVAAFACGEVMFVPDELMQSFLTEPEGLPLLDVKVIMNWMARRRLGEEQVAATWQAVGNQWIEALGESLGDPYWVLDGKNFSLLTYQDEETATRLVKFGETVLARMFLEMEGIAMEHPFGRHFIFMFRDLDTYYRYLAPYYDDEGEYAQSVGIFISYGYPHFALFDQEIRELEATVAHELTHASVAHLLLPTWLDEALAQKIEELLFGSGVVQIDRVRSARHHLHWNPQRLQEFWSGASFAEPGEGSALSYELSRILLELILSDRQAFRRFVQNAHRDDHGEQAAREHLGRGLNEIVASFLGQELVDGPRAGRPAFRVIQGGRRAHGAPGFRTSKATPET